MKNIVAKLDGDSLYLRIDLTKVVSMTSKGNEMVATTASWENLPEDPDIRINMCVVRKK